METPKRPLLTLQGLTQPPKCHGYKHELPQPSLALPHHCSVWHDKAMKATALGLASRWPLSSTSSSDVRNSCHVALKQLVLSYLSSLLLAPPTGWLAPQRRNSVFSLNKKLIHNSSNLQHFECGFLADELAQPLSLMTWGLIPGAWVGEEENWPP